MAQASKKITERRLNWYGHVMTRDEEHILRKVLRADIPSVETSNFFFYLSKSNCSQNYLSKSKVLCKKNYLSKK